MFSGPSWKWNLCGGKDCFDGYHLVSLVPIFWKAEEQIQGKSRQIDVNWEGSWKIRNMCKAEHDYLKSVVDLAKYLSFTES